MKTVLIAEDDAVLRRVFDAVFTPGDYRLLKARDGAKAWALAKEHRPSVVVLDVVLPRLNGVELLRQIRAHPEVGRPRVIAITGLHEPEARAELREVGADHVFVKPVPPSALRAAFDQAMAT